MVGGWRTADWRCGVTGRRRAGVSVHWVPAVGGLVLVCSLPPTLLCLSCSFLCPRLTQTRAVPSCPWKVTRVSFLSCSATKPYSFLPLLPFSIFSNPALLLRPAPAWHGERRHSPSLWGSCLPSAPLPRGGGLCSHSSAQAQKSLRAPLPGKGGGGHKTQPEIKMMGPLRAPRCEQQN